MTMIVKDCKLCMVPHYGDPCPWDVLEQIEFNRVMKKSLPLDSNARTWVNVGGKRVTVWGISLGEIQSEYVRRDGSDGLDVYGRKRGDV